MCYGGSEKVVAKEEGTVLRWNSLELVPPLTINNHDLHGNHFCKVCI